MSSILAGRLVASLDAAESKVGDETVILHLRSGTYFGLDPVGTRIWAMIKEGLATADICSRLTEEFDVPREVAEADAGKFLSDLKANDILVDG
jgi:hypothetical protein